MALRHDVFFALGDPTRLEIVRRLGEHGPQPTLTLVDGLGMSRQAATKHLRVLEDAGLVASTTHGRLVIRELKTKAVTDTAEWLVKRATSWDKKLDALKKLVEG